MNFQAKKMAKGNCVIKVPSMLPFAAVVALNTLHVLAQSQCPDQSNLLLQLDAALYSGSGPWQDMSGK